MPRLPPRARARLAGPVILALLSLVPGPGALQQTRQESDPKVPFPVALFGVHPPEGDAPLTVHFSDNSLGEVTSWSWDFGDGTTSHVQAPNHVYSEASVYAVTLSVQGPGGHSQRVRPEAVTARSCDMGSARTNRVAPLERGEDWVPITGDDSLGLYCVYSGKAVGGGNPGLANNVGIFVLPLVDGEVLLFGAGYGDANSFVEPTRDAAYDVLRVDAIIRFCLGREPSSTPIRFVAPHGHIDHINADFIRELRKRNYPIVDIAFHNADSTWIRSLPGWTTEDRALFRTLRNRTDACQEELTSFDSPLGKIWFFLRAGHTPGSIDLVIDVRGDPNNRFVVRGSGEIYGTCPIPGVRESIEPHGNLVFHAPVPKLFAAGPASGSVLGNTTVVLSGADFAANLAGKPLVLFDGVPASAVSVLDDGTLTCTAPPGVPGDTVDIQVENKNGRSTLPRAFSYRPLPTLSAVVPATAPTTGGTTVTLRGTGFLANDAGANAVTFGGAAASAVHALDDTTLQCTVPPGVLGTVAVTLTNQNGAVELDSAVRYVPALDVTSVTPIVGSALGNTPVQIDGAAFGVGASVPQVFFGGAPAPSVVRVSDTRLVCLTPPGPGGTQVDVRVSGDNGSDVLATGFRYFQEPKIVAIAPASGPQSGGALATLTGSQFTRNNAGPNTVRFGGVAAQGVVTVSDTVIQCLVPAGVAGSTVDVRVSNANGSGALPKGYRYLRRPTLTSLEPATGGRDGGTLVRLHGANFLETDAGLPVVTFGASAATLVTLVDDGTLTCRTPPAVADGSVDVVLSNANGSAVLAQGFHYVSRPFLDGLQPAAGSSSGGTLVTLSGRGFAAPGAGVTAITFGGAPASDVRVLADTSVSCRTPLGRPGRSVDVVLANANGSAALPGAYRYLELPTLSSVRPAEGPVAGGTRVLVSGSGFAGAAPTLRFGPAAASAVVVLDDRTLECTTPSGTAGAVNVSLRSAAGPAVLTDGFVYGTAHLALARITPDHGPSRGGNVLVLEGASFRASAAGATTVGFGGLPATAVTVQNDERLTCVAPAGAPGSRVDVRVANQNGSVTQLAGYRYHLRPALASVDPASGSPLGGSLVTLHGSGFANDDAGAPLVRFGGLPADQIAVVDDATLTCRAPGGTANTTVDVALENANGSALLAGAFRYRGAPTLAGVSPATGTPLGGTIVTLTGAEFTLAGAGTTHVFFGAAEATQVALVNDGALTCLSPAGAAGASVDVRLANDNGSAAIPGAFRYYSAPQITTLAPANGLAAGGTLVVITGSGFKTSVTGANAVSFGGKPARNVVTVDDTRVRALTPAGNPGESVDVALANANGIALVAHAFRYNARPAIAAIDPPAASGLGGTTVTIQGSGFLADGAGTNSVRFGAGAAVSVVVLDDHTLRCVEPSGPGGTSVDVAITNTNGASAPFAFAYYPAPRIDELVPPFGFSGGGARVELHGAGFLANDAGTNRVFFAANEGTELALVDDATLTCRVPAGSPGPVQVRLVNANGAATRLDGFTYDWAPTLVALAPDHGSSLGGTEVQLTGGGFQTPGAGPLAVRFGPTPATNVRVLGDGTLLCDAPAGAPGASVAVVVSNSRGSSSLGGFRYHVLPTLTSVTPDTGPPEGGTSVTLLGTGFLVDQAGPPAVTFSGASASAVTVVDDTTLQCTTPAGPARTLATLELANRNGKATFAGGFRWRARDTGDLNDDGLGDAMLSAADGVYLFFGGGLGPSDESTASADLVLRHSGASPDFGGQVASGDLNGDALADLIVAAPLDDGSGTDCGAVYVFFGPLAAAPTPRLAGSANAIFRGAAPGDHFGASVAVGDVNGDGRSDLLVGAPLNDVAGTDAGAVFVYAGRTGFASQTTAQAAVRLLGSRTLDSFGAALAAADVTGDHRDDVIVGAPLGGAASEGQVFVFRGGPTLASAGAAAALVQLDGDSNNGHLGTSVAAGDFDGDGIADLFVGAPDARSSGLTCGSIWSLRGGATLSSHQVTQNSVEFTGEATGDRLGQILALGDVNGDGRVDLLAGAPQHDVPAANAGRAYLVLGAPALASGAIAQRASTILMAENSAGDQFGYALAMADLDDDGRAELIVGAPFANGAAADSGRVYVFLGAALQATRTAGADDATFSGVNAGQGLGREIGSTR